MTVARTTEHVPGVVPIPAAVVHPETAPSRDVEPAGLAERAARLSEQLRDLGRVVVALSGGADSALLAFVATTTLGRARARCVTALSPSLAPEEEADCQALAAEWDLRWEGLPTAELEDPAYVANGADRCARCKTALMDVLGPLARADGATVVLGVNVDDLGDHRPGQAAALAQGAAFPFVDAGMTKTDVRALSRRLGLRTWDKPAAACLASRLPYGTPVSFGTLRSVAAAESGLRALGLRSCRVRHHGRVARIEVPEEDLSRVLGQRAAVVDAVQAAGYLYVALDLEGFRSGSLNRELAVPAGAGGVPAGTTPSAAGATRP